MRIDIEEMHSSVKGSHLAIMMLKPEIFSTGFRLRPVYGSQYSQIITEVRLAHYPVKEYQLSDRVLSKRTLMFHRSKTRAHTLAGTVCLAYHMNKDLSLQTSMAFLLLDYVKAFWHEHVRIASTNLEQHELTQLSINSLNKNADWNLQGPLNICRLLIYASPKDYKHLMLRLLASGANVNSKTWISDVLIRSLIERLIRFQFRNFDLEWVRRMCGTVTIECLVF